MKILKFGRLQFCMGKSECGISEKNICKGDNVIDIHIPEGNSHDIEEYKKKKY